MQRQPIREGPDCHTDSMYQTVRIMELWSEKFTELNPIVKLKL